MPPVEGFPDASRHRYCAGCRRWFEPEEGSAIRTTLWRPFDRIRRDADLPTENSEVFMCAACLRFRVAAKAVAWSLLTLIVIGLAVVSFISAIGE